MTATKAVMRPATGTLAPRVAPAVAAPKGPHAARRTACAARWRTGNNGNGAAPSAPVNGNSAAASVSVKDLPSPPPASPPPAAPAAPAYVPPPAATGETGGPLNGAFAAALSAALSRSGGQGALYEGSSSVEERESPLKPVEEMLVTALHSSRANLRRLVDRQSQLEAEIAAEQKQAQRLEWLLNRVRSDYSYFAELDRMSSSE